jgi:hypothetical protein
VTTRNRQRLAQIALLFVLFAFGWVGFLLWKANRVTIEPEVAKLETMPAKPKPRKRKKGPIDPNDDPQLLNALKKQLGFSNSPHIDRE